MGQGSRIELQTGVCFATAVAVLILPLWFFISFVIAAAIHEICHFLVLKVLRIGVYRISIGPFGASMETEAMAPGREFLCAMGGPVGSLMLVPLFRWVPGIALWGLIQGVVNLIPIYPMDGGRILKSLFQLLHIPRADRIFEITELFVSLSILGFGIWMKIHWNLWCGMIIGGIILLRIIRRKTPCKESRFGVQ